jgi:hypothetical protein
MLHLELLIGPRIGKVILYLGNNMRLKFFTKCSYLMLIRFFRIGLIFGDFYILSFLEENVYV